MRNVLVALAALLLVGCSGGGADSGKLTVVVTTEILADFVRNVGGELVDVTSVVPPGSDPHSYEPTAADARKLARADVAFTNGELLEEHAVRELFASNVRKGVPNIAIAEVAASHGINLLPMAEDEDEADEAGGDHEHEHGDIDPHAWEDVRNAQAYVQVIADTLIAAAPAHRAAFEANRDAYLGELRDVDTYIKGRVAQIPASNRRLVTTHDAFSYLADAYGLDVVAVVVENPEQEPSAKQVSRLTEALRALPVRAVFLEPNLAARSMVLRQVAKDQNAAVCILYGDAFDKNAPSYIEMMRHNGDELLRCLRGS